LNALHGCHFFSYDILHNPDEPELKIEDCKLNIGRLCSDKMPQCGNTIDLFK
jgi:hypothetical protein